ncbi:TetR/AcrR family transcriptional regulator [Zhongshania sp.]|uniref:TetR/AcrR family transcriptional regulator n=1 Tax=Zhongshania sp. TaxID=1971902 RepID=UPI00356342F8
MAVYYLLLLRYEIIMRHHSYFKNSLFKITIPDNKMNTMPLKRKPKQARAEVTRSIIIESAAQILLKRDYASSTTNRIAERAGVSVGSIYQYFSNKNDIYESTLDYYLSKLAAGVISMDVSVNLSISETFEIIVTKVYGEWPEGPELLRKLRQSPDPHFHDKILDLKRTIVSYFSSLVKGRDEISHLESKDLNISLNICMDSIEGIFLNASPDISPARLAKEISLICSRYLTAQGDE